MAHGLAIFLCILGLTARTFGESSCSDERCEHGRCVKNQCLCNPCWSGTHCTETANHPPHFSHGQYEFYVDHEIMNSEDRVVGTVFATDEDIGTECGLMEFAIEDYLGSGLLKIDHQTGTISLAKQIMSELRTDTYSTTVTVRNLGAFQTDEDTAIVEIHISEEYESEKEAEHVLSRPKRATSGPTSTVGIFTDINVLPSDQFCLGCSVITQYTLFLEPHCHPLSLKFSFDPPSVGYTPTFRKISYISAGSMLQVTGSPSLQQNIDSTTNIVTGGTYSIPTVCTVNTTSASLADWSVVYQYQLVFLPDYPGTVGTVITVNLETSYGGVFQIDQMSFTIAASLPSSLTVDCPTVPSRLGDEIYVLAKGYHANYWVNDTLRVTSYAPSASVQLITSAYGAEFNYLTGYRSQDVGGSVTVQSSMILQRTRAYIMEWYYNDYAGATNKPMGASYVNWTVVIKISPWASTRAVIGFYAVLTSGIFAKKCYIDITTDTTGYTLNPGVSFTTSQLYTSVGSANSNRILAKITFPAGTVQSYTVQVQMQGKRNAEIVGALVSRAGAAISPTGNLQPLVSYVRDGYESYISSATVYFGTIQSLSMVGVSSDWQVDLYLVVYVNADGSAVTGDTVQYKIQVLWNTGSTAQSSGSFTVGVVSPPVIPVPSALKPTISLLKLEPQWSNPPPNYGIVVTFSVTFSMNFLYSPVVLWLKSLTTSAIIMERGLENIGSGLEMVVPVGCQYFAMNTSMAVLKLQYIRTTSSVGNDIVLRFVIVSTASFQVEGTAFYNGEYVQQTLTVTLGSALSTSLPPARIPQFVLSSGNGLPANGLIQGRVNLVLAEMSVQPNASSIYGLQLTMSQSSATAGFCIPVRLPSDSRVGVPVSSYTMTATTNSIPLSYIYHQYSTAQQITYAIPMIVRSAPPTPVSMTGVFTYGNGSCAAPFSGTVQTTSTSGTPTATAGRIHVLDFNSRTTRIINDPVARGETIRYFYELLIPPNTCGTYSLRVTYTVDGFWPMDIASLYVQDRDPSVWCLDPSVLSVSSYSSSTSTGSALLNEVNLNLGEICSSGPTTSWIRLVGFVRARQNNQNPSQSNINWTRQFSILMTVNNVAVPSQTKTLSYVVNSANAFIPQTSMYTANPEIYLPNPIQTAQLMTAIQVTIAVKFPSGAKLGLSTVSFACDKVSGTEEAQCIMSTLGVNCGRSLRPMCSERPAVYSQSDTANGLVNNLTMNVGNMVNQAIGLSLELAEYGTEQLVVYVNLMVTDCKTAENLSIVPMKISAQLGSYSVQGIQPIKILRPTNQTMDINTTLGIDNPDSGANITVSISMAMLPTTTMECYKRGITIWHTEFFQSIAVVSQKTKYSPFIPSPQSQNNTFNLTAGGFYLGSTASVQINLKLLKDATFAWPRFFTLTTEFTCMAYPRTTPAPSIGLAGHPGRYVASEQFDLCSQGIYSFIDQCRCELPVSITAQSYVYNYQYNDPEHPVQEIKQLTPIGWKIPARGPFYTKTRFVDILFGAWKNVSSFNVLELDSVNSIKKLAIYATNDGVAFYFVEEIPVYYETERHGNASLTRSLLTRGVRAVVTGLTLESEEAIFNIDVLGFDSPNDVRSFDPGKTPNSINKAADGYLPTSLTSGYATYVANGQQLFFCDFLMFAQSWPFNRRRCHRIDGSTYKLKELGPYVGQVTAYIPSQNLLFGIGSEETSLLLSRDTGKTWKTINGLAYSRLTQNAPDMIKATPVYWMKTGDVKSTVYQTGDWTINSVGIYYKNRIIVDWNNTCPDLASLNI